MVFNVCLKWLSFKQKLDDICSLLENQTATYVILKYAHDIPQSIFVETMDILIENKETLFYEKLIKFVELYEKNSSLVMTADEEFVETVFLDPDTMSIVKEDLLLEVEDE